MWQPTNKHDLLGSKVKKRLEKGERFQRVGQSETGVKFKFDLDFGKVV